MRPSAEKRPGTLRALLCGAVPPLLFATPVGAQVGVVVRGVVEDAMSREPVAGARVLSGDSSSVVLTDSVGVFSIEIEAEEPLVVHVDRFGYVPRRFDLSDDVRSSEAILLLHPAAIELETVDVVAEGATARVFRDLRGRRNAYAGPLRVFDRATLQPYRSFGNAWDFVRLRVPLVYECSSALSGLCARGRYRSFISSYDEGNPVRVCVDAWPSWGAVSELGSLDMRDIALVEIYDHGRGGIRVYTSAYVAIAARTGRNVATPLWWGC